MKQAILIAIGLSLMAAQCNTCFCEHVIEKESLAAGWCVIRTEDCDGVITDYAVDEVEYAIYNEGYCYP